MMRNIMRGDLYYANLDPVVGSEQGGSRPVIVLQNNVGNKYSPTIIIAAITSKITQKSKLPTHCYLEAEHGLEVPSIILLEQIRTIDKIRLGGYIGTLDELIMNNIKKALLISFGI